MPASQEQEDDDLQRALRLSMLEAEVSKPVVIEDSQELDQNEDEQLRR